MSLYLGEDRPYQGGHFLHNLLLFSRVCKALGMNLSPGRVIEVSQALEHIQIGYKTDFYYTLRCLMVTRQRDLELFDYAFELFWKRPLEGQSTLVIDSMGEKPQKRKPDFLPPMALDADDEEKNPLSADEETQLAIVLTYSQENILRHKDFADMTDEELSMAKSMIERLPKSLGERKSRRYQVGKGRLMDVRKTFRRNMRYGGEIFDLPTRTVKLKPRPVVLICDISGSMERYTRILLHFMHTLANHLYQVESFVFSTRLSRVTHQIRHKSVDRALHEVGYHVNTWGGGTKTGDALQQFNYRWSRRVLGRGAVVLLITDGWDRGEPDLLIHEMERLQKSCHRLIWLNPLLGGAQYAPLTRGAQAMLPYADDFLPVRNLANLEMIVKELQKLNWKRPEKLAHAHYIAQEK